MGDKKYRVVVLMGKSASGKDTIANKLCEMFPNLNRKISTTTRPSREGEVDGVDYHFISNEKFTEKVLNYEMIEASCFREWFYGTEIRAFDENKINVGIFNPEGVAALRESKELELLIFYVIAPDSTRLIRSLKREGQPDIEEIFRRYKTDKEDFSEINYDYYPIINGDKDSLEENIEIIRKRIVEVFGHKK